MVSSSGFGALLGPFIGAESTRATETFTPGLVKVRAGMPIPQSQWCIPPISHFPTLEKISESLKIFSTFGKFFQLLKKISFHPPKFLMTFFSHLLWFSPYFLKNATFPRCFGKFIVSPVLHNYPRWIYLFLTCFTCFSFPLFWPCTGRPVDAPESVYSLAPVHFGHLNIKK